MAMKINDVSNITLFYSSPHFFLGRCIYPISNIWTHAFLGRTHAFLGRMHVFLGRTHAFSGWAHAFSGCLSGHWHRDAGRCQLWPSCYGHNIPSTGFYDSSLSPQLRDPPLFFNLLLYQNSQLFSDFFLILLEQCCVAQMKNVLPSSGVSPQQRHQIPLIIISPSQTCGIRTSSWWCFLPLVVSHCIWFLSVASLSFVISFHVRLPSSQKLSTL